MEYGRKSERDANARFKPQGICTVSFCKTVCAKKSEKRGEIGGEMEQA